MTIQQVKIEAQYLAIIKAGHIQAIIAEIESVEGGYATVVGTASSSFQIDSSNSGPYFVRSGDKLKLVASDMTTPNNFQVGDLESQNQIVYGDMDIRGKTDIDGNIDVGGLANIVGRLDVGGHARINGDTSVGGKITVMGDQYVGGNVNVAGGFVAQDMTSRSRTLIIGVDSTGDGCVELKRENELSAKLLWDEVTGLWKAGLSGSEIELSRLGHVHDTRYFTKDDLTSSGALDVRYYTETELDDGALDTRYYSKTELDSTSMGLVRDTRLVSTDEITLTGGGDLKANRTLSVLDNSSIQKSEYALASTLVAARKRLNFIQDGAIIVSVTDNTADDRVDVTIGTPVTQGEANTASNVNTDGYGLWKDKNGVDLRFKGVKAGSNKVILSDSTSDGTISIDVDEAQIGQAMQEIGDMALILALSAL